VKTAACPVPVPAVPTPLVVFSALVKPVAVYTELKIGLPPKYIFPIALEFPLEESLSPADRFDIEGIISTA
jgi:hypothetical protein